jgi:bifunctional non-homologous end joining protein LigD
MPLERRLEPFDHPDWIFELKFDGFRALAFVRPSSVALVSRNGNAFRQFAPLLRDIRDAVLPPTAILDGEIVCLDNRGHPQFTELLFRRGTPCFVAFDVLKLGRLDLRRIPLLARKALLRRLVRPDAGVLVPDHVRAHGRDLCPGVR